MRVAVEAALPSELPRLVEGLRLLNRADPFLEVTLQDKGEYVLGAAGIVWPYFICYSHKGVSSHTRFVHHEYCCGITQPKYEMRIDADPGHVPVPYMPVCAYVCLCIIVSVQNCVKCQRQPAWLQVAWKTQLLGSTYQHIACARAWYMCVRPCVCAQLQA